MSAIAPAACATASATPSGPGAGANWKAAYELGSPMLQATRDVRCSKVPRTYNKLHWKPNVKTVQEEAAPEVPKGSAAPMVRAISEAAQGRLTADVSKIVAEYMSEVHPMVQELASLEFFQHYGLTEERISARLTNSAPNSMLKGAAAFDAEFRREGRIKISLCVWKNESGYAVLGGGSSGLTQALLSERGLTLAELETAIDRYIGRSETTILLPLAANQ